MRVLYLVLVEGISRSHDDHGETGLAVGVEAETAVSYVGAAAFRVRLGFGEQELAIDGDLVGLGRLPCDRVDQRASFYEGAQF